MPTALVLVTAVVLGMAGAWGTARLLSRLRLSPAESLALTLALFPALLGEAAFIGLLVGQPGAVLPTVCCVVLGVLGWFPRGPGGGAALSAYPMKSHQSWPVWRCSPQGRSGRRS